MKKLFFATASATICLLNGNQAMALQLSKGGDTTDLKTDKPSKKSSKIVYADHIKLMKFKDLYESELDDEGRESVGSINSTAFIAADKILDLSDTLDSAKEAVESALDRFKLRGPKGS